MKSLSTRKSCLVIAITFGLLMSACKPSAKQQAAPALDALQKIQAALKIKTSYQDYSQLMTDAQFQVDKASSLLPDGELKKELKASLDAYSDAKWAWEISRQAPESDGHEFFILAAELEDLKEASKTLSIDRKNGNKAEELFRKYSLISGTVTTTDLILITTDQFLRAIWREGDKHVERAKSLNS
ncbi:MAG: hypothetical protein ABR577_04570 [Pyrinomonadaceae bacterium]